MARREELIDWLGSRFIDDDYLYNDIPDVSRQEVEQFIKTIHRTLNDCSEENLEACNKFICQHIIINKKRCRAFANFLLEVSLNCDQTNIKERKLEYGAPDKEGNRQLKPEPEEYTGLSTTEVNGRLPQPPPPHKKRLHVLEIMEKVFTVFRVKPSFPLYKYPDWCPFDDTHDASPSRRGLKLDDVKELTGILPYLVTLAAYEDTSVPLAHGYNVTKRIKELAKLPNEWTDWDEDDVEAFGKHNTFLDSHDIQELRNHVTKARKAGSWSACKEAVLKEFAPRQAIHDREMEEEYAEMPYTHGLPGDEEAAWHELPAANGLYMKRTYGYPLKSYAMPPGGYPLRSGGHPISDDLKNEVKFLKREMISQFTKYTNLDDVKDIDALGNVIHKDVERPTRNYWGYTLEGPKKMKETREYFEGKAKGYEPPPKEWIAAERARQVEADRARRQEEARKQEGDGYGRGYGQRSRGGYGRGL